MPVKQDYWWVINDRISIAKLTAEILTILREIAVPEIAKYISNESLEKRWMEGNCDGITEPQMYLYLIALLKAHNSSDLQYKITELKEKSRGKPYYRNIEENLLKLGITDV